MLPQRGVYPRTVMADHFSGDGSELSWLDHLEE